MVDISVIVPTHNRATPFLENCLISICEQTLEPSRYEICVVANACTDNTPEVVTSIAARYPKHKIFIVADPVPGLSRARNTGLRATTAPLVANIDDDGTVYPDWLTRFMNWFTDLGSDLAIVTGDIEPVWEIPRPDWITDWMCEPLSAKTVLGNEPRYLTETDWGPEGNSCYRRQAIEQAGYFPEELGRVGANLLSGEGSVEHNIRKNGGKLFYDPKIILRHFIHANRLRPLWFRQRYFWHGISAVAVREYKIKHGMPLKAEAHVIDLPLKKEDWAFITKDTPENILQSLGHFRSLGFALALSGIVPIENEE